jgi:rhodanese-related sulfurtransferase
VVPTYDALIRDLRTKTSEVDAAGLSSELAGTAPAVIDVREADEHAQGMIPTTQHIPRGFLEMRIEKAVPNREAPVVVYCQSGTRSVFAARTLTELGYTNVRSLTGGFTGWKTKGLPFEQPIVLSGDQRARYSRHTLIPEVGVAGQLKLLQAKVLCIGAGGLLSVEHVPRGGGHRHARDHR